VTSELRAEMNHNAGVPKAALAWLERDQDYSNQWGATREDIQNACRIIGEGKCKHRENPMIDESKLNQATARAVRAQDLLDNELLTEAFERLEENYTAAWRATTIDNAGAREKLFLAINVVGKVRDHLAAIVANGNLAQAELKELAQTAERRKRFGIV
jgi:hypothetical protein